METQIFHEFHEAKFKYLGKARLLLPVFVSAEVSLLMATYKCEACGNESSAPGSCCGSEMKKM
jgi:hypothetical protein